MELVLKQASGGAVATARSVLAREGVWGFWKGNVINVLRTAPFKALNFFSFDIYHKKLAEVFHKDGNAARFTAGAAAGVTATIVCFPLDVVRTRLMAQGAGPRYGGMVGTFVGIVRHEGLQGLYTGCLPALVGMAPAGSIFYGMFDMLKSRQLELIRAERRAAGLDPEQPIHLDALRTMMFGAVSGMCSELVVYPLEVVRRRMQLQSMAAAAARTGIPGHQVAPLVAAAAAAAAGAPVARGAARVASTIRDVWRADGLAGFYSGMKPNLLQVLPSSALSYYTYEKMKMILGVDTSKLSAATVGRHHERPKEKPRWHGYLPGLVAGNARVTPHEAVAANHAGNVTVLGSADLDDEDPLLGYDLMQGPLVRWTKPGMIAPPTAVLVHGILGSRRNMQSFARMLLEACPAWQILMVDLRCHGESAALDPAPPAPHTVAAASSDLLELLRRLKLFPHVLVGHSFGGKVVMGMVQQFGAVLPRPVQVWVLDSLPGEVRAPRSSPSDDHPCELIKALITIPMPVATRNVVIDTLTGLGFTRTISQWAATNLRPVPGGQSGVKALHWTFDLEGILQMYRSYESTSMYTLIEAPPQGLQLDFVKAEHSNFRWGGDDEARIAAAGHRVHLLRDAGHWVHTDNPSGLLGILSSSFGLREPAGSPRR
ncbi:hypothetical protein FOA52_006156 [Chlamydomonas sp. UWO 241]|nr:hypothetical protein FOA52_006156 [Chlamydomonas sp. UWO 241]